MKWMPRAQRSISRGSRSAANERVGHPVCTPYSVRRMRVDGVSHDARLANPKAGIQGPKGPTGYTWYGDEAWN